MDLDGYETRLPARKVTYDTLEEQSFVFHIDTAHFTIDSYKVIKNYLEEKFTMGDSSYFGLEGRDTTFLKSYNNMPNQGWVSIPYGEGYYQLDTLWEAENPAIFLAIDTSYSSSYEVSYLIKAQLEEVFQTENWLESFQATYPYYQYNLTYFNGKDWTRITQDGEIKDLESNFMDNQKSGMGWFALYLFGNLHNELAPEFFMLIELED